MRLMRMRSASWEFTENKKAPRVLAGRILTGGGNANGEENRIS